MADDYLPYQRHSSTSRAAAESVEPKASIWLGKVLACIRSSEFEGMTDEQQQEALGLNPSTQRPRRVDLVNRGLVVDSGKKRRTRSGRLAVVWIAKEYARLQLELLVTPEGR